MLKRDEAAFFLFGGKIEIIEVNKQGQELSFKVKTKIKDEFSVNASKFKVSPRQNKISI